MGPPLRILLALALALVVALTLLPPGGAQEATYRVDGLPRDYTRSTTYFIGLNLSAPGPVAGLEVEVTNGTLELAANGGFTVREDGLALNTSGNLSNWVVAWQAPTKAFTLGEGEAIFTITFLRADDNGTANGTWAVHTLVVRPPAIVAPEAGGAPGWARQLAWLGVALTAVLVVVAWAGLRFSREPRSDEEA